MDWTGCDATEVVPGKLSGVPILKHSRVSADAVLESYELGESAEEIAYSHSLDPEQIRKVLAFAHEEQSAVDPAVCGSDREHISGLRRRRLPHHRVRVPFQTSKG